MKFTTSGPHVVDPDGNKFIPIGANVTAEPSPVPPPDSWWSTDQTYATGHSGDAAEWGWNFVRVSVATGGAPHITVEHQFDGVFALIDEYTAKGIVVTASLWDFMGDNPTWADVEANPHVLALQDQLVARYRGNPFVWLNPLNEPFDKSYGDDWFDVGNRLYERARSQGWDGIFVWDLPMYGQYMEAAATTSMGTDFLAGKYSTVFAWHNYGAGDDARQDAWAQAVIDKGLPVVITEFGQHWNPNDHSNRADAAERRGAAWTLDRVWTYGFGAVAWHASAGSYNQYSLRMATGAAWWEHPGAPPLSDVGRRLREVAAARPAPIPVL